MQNQKDLEETKEEYRTTCLNNAEAITYMIESNPDVLEDLEKYPNDNCSCGSGKKYKQCCGRNK